MKMKKRLTAVIALLMVLVLIAGCAAKESNKLKVVTGTSLINNIVQEVGGDKVEVVNIIPPGSCPGHFDLKPDDVQKLATAQLFLLHTWQGEMFTRDLIDSVRNEQLAVMPVDVAGNWMAPPAQKEAVQKIAAVLAEKDPANKTYYEQNAARIAANVEAKGTELLGKLNAASAANVKVICADMQQGFLKWAGFDVVATYGRQEELTPQVMQNLVVQGRQAGVKLVVDNLQSGPETGAGIARELGAARVTLSNFPGAFPQTDTWSSAVEKNVDLLVSALKGH